MRSTGLQAVVAGHTARNRELCKLIRSKGVDLAASRSIDLHFWADGEIAAHRLATALRKRGWSRVTVDPTEDEGVWNVEVEIDRSVLEVVDDVFTKEIARLAMDNQSEFDGWGTSL